MSKSERILTLMKDSRNQHVLDDELENHYKLSNGHRDKKNPFEASFDACLLDTVSLNNYADELRTLRNEKAPVFLPSLLLVRDREERPESSIDEDLVDEVLTMPADLTTLRARLENLLEKRRLSLRLEDLNNNLQAKVDQKTETIRTREEEIVMRLVSASTYRDEETGAHIKRLGLYAEVLARELGWSQDRIDDMRLAAPMHDIGKIGIPDDILKHPGDLSDEEFDIMKRHTTIGSEIIGESNVDLLQTAQNIALTHHEQWDGSGYPRGLAGEEIPVEGRLVAIADVYDALVHDRVYRDALPEPEALRIIEDDRGSHFDPRMHDLFFDTLPKLRAVRQLNPDSEEEDNERT